MNRDDLRQLAQIRLREARALLKNRSNHGAYYLCGYVIECGLKACIAKQTKMYDFPDKETVNKSYTHDLSRLVKVSGLERDLDSEMTKDTTFALNWAIVKDWSEESRYKKHTTKKAKDLYSAISNKQHGVLRWIKQHW